MTTSPRPPKHLQAEGRKYWRYVVRHFGVAPWQEHELAVACESLDVIADCREQIEAEGLTFVDRYGQVKQHPLLTVARDHRNLFLKAVKQLGLDKSPVKTADDDDDPFRRLYE